MSEHFLILIWLGLMALFGGVVNLYRWEPVLGKMDRRVLPGAAVLTLFPVILFAGGRNYSFGDTWAYAAMFRKLPETFGELIPYVQSMEKDPGFTVLSGLIRLIFGNSENLYFLILAAIQGSALLIVFRKYSSNYLMCIFLFIASTDYLSWMHNGIRQFTAVTIIFATTKWMLQKRYAPLIAVILLASTVHGSAILMLPVVLIVQGSAWNKKTLLVITGCICTLVFVDQFTGVLETLLVDTQYNSVVNDWETSDDDGTNVLRVLVYAIPAILSFFGRRWIWNANNPVINLCTNMALISASLYVISAVTSGIFMGRLPIYCSLYGYILLPWLIEHMFEKQSARVITAGMIAMYLLLYYFQIHFVWGLV